MDALTREQHIEKAVKQVSCPVCGRGVGARCDYKVAFGLGGTPTHSHTGRYRAAVAAGLVQPFAGER